MRNLLNSYTTLQNHKVGEKRVHHDALLWDTEIPPSDPNNFVRNSAEPRFCRIILALMWDFLVPQHYI